MMSGSKDDSQSTFDSRILLVESYTKDFTGYFAQYQRLLEHGYDDGAGNEELFGNFMDYNVYYDMVIDTFCMASEILGWGPGLPEDIFPVEADEGVERYHLFPRDQSLFDWAAPDGQWMILMMPGLTITVICALIMGMIYMTLLGFWWTGRRLIKECVPTRTHQMVLVGRTRHSTRGRLQRPQIILQGCILLSLVIGGEASGIAVKALGNPNWKQCSIGEPATPPDIPNLLMEETVEIDDPQVPPSVILMNGPTYLDPWATDGIVGYDPPSERPYNMIMFGYKDGSLGRRDSEIENFEPRTIKEAILATWWDQIDAVMEVYVVDPQPMKLTPEGWTVIINFHTATSNLPGGHVLALKEVVIFRRTGIFPDPADFEAHPFRARNSLTVLIEDADLVPQCDPQRLGHCSVKLDDNLVLRGILVRVMQGSYVTFMVDEALPDPVTIFTLQDPLLANQALENVLRGCSRFQYLNVYLHGYHTEYLGTQSYTAPRTRVEDWSLFTAAAARLWQGDIFQNARIISANPQRGLQAVDGEIIVHYIVDFGRRESCLALLSRQVDEHLPSFTVLEVEEWFTPHTLLQMVDWTEHIRHHGLPDISWGPYALGIDEILQSRHGMHLHFAHETSTSSSSTPELQDRPDEDDQHELLQLWHASDTMHGRTVGMNGQRQLRPPGNGHKRINFSNIVHILTPWGSNMCIDVAAQNDFIEEIGLGLAQHEVPTGLNNPFLTDFREDTIRAPQARYSETDLWTPSLLDALQAQAFGNPFVTTFVQEILHPTEESDEPKVHGGGERPRIHLSLDKLIPQKMTEIRVPFVSSTIPDWLITPWRHYNDMQTSKQIPEEMELHPATDHWLQLEQGGVPPGAWFIYTDGSFLEYRERASWAIALCHAPDRFAPVDKHTFVAWYGGLLNDEADPMGLPIDKIDATNAEGAALLWAALFALAHHEDQLDLVFCFDSKGLGQAAAGRYNYTSAYPLASAVRKIHQAVESLWGPTRVFHQHVKGHSGNPANELVNSLAQEVAKRWIVPNHPHLPLKVLFEQETLMNTLWLLLDPQLSTQVWPSRTDSELCCPDGRSLQGLPLNYDWNFNYGQRAVAMREKDIQIDLKLLTFNVQSLLGKVHYLRAQLHHSGYALIGLQETATREDRVSSADGFLRVTSQAQEGIGGLEVWFSIWTPVAWIGPRPLYWDLTSLVVLHHDNQLMMMKCSIPGLGCYLIINAHAPHSGIEDSQKAHWWQRFLHLLRAHRHGLPIILLIDANVQVGSIPCEGIGPLHAGEEDHNGEWLRTLVMENEAWFPATFSHIGSPFTWFSPASHLRQGRRIDYVGVPRIWRSLVHCSWVDTEIDNGHKGIDHFALALQVRGPLAGYKMKQPRGDGIDWPAIRAHEDDTVWPAVFAEIPNIPWAVDTHKHWADLQGALVTSLQKFFPRPSRAPQRHYISTEAWTLRRTRNYHKRIWRSAAKVQEETTLQAALRAWHDALDYDTWRDRALLRTLRLAMKVLTAGRKLAGLSKQLKQQVREDKKAFIRMTVEQAQYDPSQLYKTLRKAGFGSARRQRHQPLPCLLEAGIPCRSTDELQLRWLQHFAAIEGGYEVSKGEMLQLCKLSDCTQTQQGLSSWDSMPTLKQLEDGLRRSQNHKAAGIDGLVPELCKKACKWLAKATFPLLAKTVIYRSEPIQWKGGVLHPIWKKKGPLTDPHSFRGILVSSQIGKTVHALFRHRALPAYTERAGPFQCGGVPGRSVAQAAHACRLQQKP